MEIHIFVVGNSWKFIFSLINEGVACIPDFLMVIVYLAFHQTHQDPKSVTTRSSSGPRQHSSVAALSDTGHPVNTTELTSFATTVQEATTPVNQSIKLVDMNGMDSRFSLISMLVRYSTGHADLS